MTDLMHRLRLLADPWIASVRPEEMRRLFDHDTAAAYQVLARERSEEPESPHVVLRLARRLHLFVAGLASRLSPPRRILFVTALVLAVLGVLELRFNVGSGGRVVLDGSPLLPLASVGLLVLLLGLELVDRLRVRDELELARDLQRQLLPRAAPALPGYSFAHTSRTANEVGGDTYDFLPLPDGRLALVAGDASGHGMAAGLVMAIAHATLRLAVDLDPEPRAVAALVNRALWRTGGRRAFMTLFYGLLHPASGRLDFICAGHPFPLLRRADGTLEELGNGCVPLGLREAPQATAHATVMAPGDLLVLYSDGVFEAIDPAGESFGHQRLRDLVGRGGSPADVQARILLALEQFLAGRGLSDDVTVVVMGR